MITSISVNKSLPLWASLNAPVISDPSSEQRCFGREAPSNAIFGHWVCSSLFLLRVIMLNIHLNYKSQLCRTVSCRRFEKQDSTHFLCKAHICCQRIRHTGLEWILISKHMNLLCTIPLGVCKLDLTQYVAAGAVAAFPPFWEQGEGWRNI